MAKKRETSQDENFTILSKMLGLIQKHGVWNIIKAFLLLLMFAIVMYSVTHVDDLVQKAFKEQSEEITNKHDAVMEHRSSIKPKIDLILKEALNELNADRVFVIEMHNGTNNLSGLPFVYCEMTYEVCKPGIDRVDDEYGAVVLSRYTLPYYMSEHRYFVGSVDELETMDSKLAHRMKANGSAYLCVTNMYGVNNYLGYVGIGFAEGSEVPPNEEMIDAVFKLSQQISTLLDVSNIEQ